MKTFPGAAALALVTAATFSNAATREEALASLVAAERAFAQASLDSGYKASFLGVLAEDSTVYQPGPVNGRETVAAAEEPPIVLSWYPVVADVAASGDLGYTSGPYTVTPKDPAETRRGSGHYTSIWRRKPGGPWELLVDLGTPHPAAAEPLEPWQPVSGETSLADALGDTELEDRATALRSRDAALGEVGGAEPFVKVLADFAEPGVRIYRPGAAPLEGLAAAGSHERTATELVTSAPVRAVVSSAGDWGYTLGSSKIMRGERSIDAHYMRLWHRSTDGEWMLFLDTFAPMPPPRPPAG